MSKSGSWSPLVKSKNSSREIDAEEKPSRCRPEEGGFWVGGVQEREGLRLLKGGVVG
jgi:hypothetical protein